MFRALDIQGPFFLEGVTMRQTLTATVKSDIVTNFMTQYPIRYISICILTLLIFISCTVSSNAEQSSSAGISSLDAGIKLLNENKPDDALKEFEKAIEIRDRIEEMQKTLFEKIKSESRKKQ